MFGIKRDNDNLEKIKQEVKGSNNLDNQKNEFEIPEPPKAPEFSNSSNNFGNNNTFGQQNNPSFNENSSVQSSNNMFNISNDDLTLPENSFNQKNDFQEELSVQRQQVNREIPKTYNNQSEEEEEDNDETENLTYKKVTKPEYNFNFVKKKEEKPIFIKTKQYQDLLESVEEIKNKIKSSYDTYLRISELKSEEDIEVENLRKEFEEIETKLYRIDQILFEN